MAATSPPILINSTPRYVRVSQISLRYLSGQDIDALAMTNVEILRAVERCLIDHGNGYTVVEPRTHLIPNPDFDGHFNILRGYIAPIDTAGFKIVGDYKQI